MKTLLKSIVTLSVLLLVGCSEDDVRDISTTAINVKFGFSEECASVSPAPAWGQILLFDENGTTVDRHMISPKIFYHDSTVTLITSSPTARRMILLYGEISDFLCAEKTVSMARILDESDGFTSRTGESMFGINNISLPLNGNMLELTMPVYLFVEGVSLRKHIN